MQIGMLGHVKCYRPWRRYRWCKLHNIQQRTSVST